MSDRGTVLPVLALVMVGGALAVALSVELGRCGAAWREASFAADAGAEAGAAQLDPGAVYSGRIRLDPAGRRRGSGGDRPRCPPPGGPPGRG